MSRVYVVRHGNTFDTGDTILRVGGRTDLPLSRSGSTQAEALRDHFSNLEFSTAFSSDLKRTRQTLETITGAQSYKIANMLTEIDYGLDEGRPETDVIDRIGNEALRLWDEKAIPPNGWHVNPEQIRRDWVSLLAQLPRHDNTLVVTSNGTARFLLDVVKGGHNAERKLRTGAYGIIRLADTGPELESWNIRP